MSDQQNEWVFIGLGNPGKKYEMTRHNLGFLVIDALAQELGWNLHEDKKFHSKCTKGVLFGKTLHLLQPATYMNESGQAARAYLAYYKLAPKNVVIINDDVEFAFGVLRLKPVGSAGGHNGLKSIEAHLGTKHYARLRLGIGRGKGQQELASHVLDPFSQEELHQLPALISKAVDALKIIASKGLAAAMQSVNAKEKSEVKMQIPNQGSGEQQHESN